VLVVALCLPGCGAVLGGPRPDLVVKRRFQGAEFYTLNPAAYEEAAGRPVHEILNWDDVAFQVPLDKPGGVYRVFVLGGAVALGYPPDPAFAFPRICALMLRDAYPDVVFEVYNAACPGMDAEGLPRAADSCCRAGADALVVCEAGPLSKDTRAGLSATARRADASVIFCTAARGQAPGDDGPYGASARSYDGMHLTFGGNYALAETVLRQLAATLAEEGLSREGPPPDPLSQNECRHRLGLTDAVVRRHLREVLRLPSAPPHTDGAPGIADRREGLLDGLRDLQRLPGAASVEQELAGYRAALEDDPSDRFLRARLTERLLEQGRDTEALALARALAAEHPYHHVSRRLFGVALGRAGSADDAMWEFRRAIMLYPHDAGAFYQWGVIWENMGKTVDARRTFGQALAIQPGHAGAACGMVRVLAGEG